TPNASTATSNPRDATRLHTQLDKLEDPRRDRLITASSGPDHRAAVISDPDVGDATHKHLHKPVKHNTTQPDTRRQ
ncbi:MAG: hypothetical protein B5766_07040, partial [Candidatus Lumbricidophila eiseniae]